jgi:hypothetical protein
MATRTPFFRTACTAWNGAMKSTEVEWETYLKQRRDKHYNVIQYITTIVAGRRSQCRRAWTVDLAQKYRVFGKCTDWQVIGIYTAA